MTIVDALQSAQFVVNDDGKRTAVLMDIQAWESLKTFVADLTKQWPGIEKTPGVVGGDACIVRTRIPVWALAGYRRLGWSDEQLLENFPALSAQDLTNAWTYVANHQDEIEQALLENEEA